ncbi:MAG: hypothetical protein LBS64_06065 [Spirochaetaceae bacterium]|jgi:hypothetical protein|nr:hypothetical protein [Spirochaetaceae bacterium]
MGKTLSMSSLPRRYSVVVLLSYLLVTGCTAEMLMISSSGRAWYVDPVSPSAQNVEGRGETAGSAFASLNYAIGAANRSSSSKVIRLLSSPQEDKEAAGLAKREEVRAGDPSAFIVVDGAFSRLIITGLAEDPGAVEIAGTEGWPAILVAAGSSVLFEWVTIVCAPVEGGGIFVQESGAVTLGTGVRMTAAGNGPGGVPGRGVFCSGTLYLTADASFIPNYEIPLAVFPGSPVFLVGGVLEGGGTSTTDSVACLQLQLGPGGAPVSYRVLCGSLLDGDNYRKFTIVGALPDNDTNTSPWRGWIIDPRGWARDKK